MNDYLNGDGSGQTLIFTTQEMDKTNLLIKRLNKEARIIECNPPDKNLGQVDNGAIQAKGSELH